VDQKTLRDHFPVMIEIPKGCKNKYEFDKISGYLRLNRVLFSAVHYPANYGFIPQTYAEDGDPLDVLVLGQEPVHPMTLVETKAIGVIQMNDEMGNDDKIVGVSIYDPAFCAYNHHYQLPKHILLEIKRFFQDYKILENRSVLIDEILGPQEAYAIIDKACNAYRTKFA
jgi:inorganic pyrophosphatase